MIYITGDTHGDFRRFSTDIFPEQKEMTKDDFVIICGDFGGIWCQEVNRKALRNENYWLDWLDKKPFTTLFVDGNHENFLRLNSFPEKEWNGGVIHAIRPSVFHLMRGEVFNIQNKIFFTFGGASSHDISDGILDYYDPDWRQKAQKLDKAGRYMYRVKGLSWWPEEIPSREEMRKGLKNLENINNEVDFIITHCGASSSIALYSHGCYKPDVFTDYLEGIRQKIKFKKWIMGHYHDNHAINDKELIIYEQIVRIV